MQCNSLEFESIIKLNEIKRNGNRSIEHLFLFKRTSETDNIRILIQFMNRNFVIN